MPALSGGTIASRGITSPVLLGRLKPFVSMACHRPVLSRIQQHRHGPDLPQVQQVFSSVTPPACMCMMAPWPLTQNRMSLRDDVPLRRPSCENYSAPAAGSNASGRAPADTERRAVSHDAIVIEARSRDTRGVRFPHRRLPECRQASMALTPGSSPKRALASRLRMVRPLSAAWAAMIKSCAPRGEPDRRTWASRRPW